MSLLLQYSIIVSVWILSLLLILIIPRQKRRLAMVAFLFKQYITCIFGHAVVELQLLAYPVRELADVSRTSFTYEYMAYPMTCAVFNAYYPSHRSGWIQFGYYVLFTTVQTIVEVLLVQYTDLIRYVRWNWLCPEEVTQLTLAALLLPPRVALKNVGILTTNPYNRKQ
ncbi:CBO0543 family protein [Paenibacillus sp. TAB 01]|uniref:CBO0543 family protein n=1 Tax=Paenibacillus sp. TAB 01 TaxID=3368988 RepID=UPI003753815B